MSAFGCTDCLGYKGHVWMNSGKKNLAIPRRSRRFLLWLSSVNQYKFSFQLWCFTFLIFEFVNGLLLKEMRDNWIDGSLVPFVQLFCYCKWEGLPQSVVIALQKFQICLLNEQIVCHKIHSMLTNLQGGRISAEIKVYLF